VTHICWLQKGEGKNKNIKKQETEKKNKPNKQMKPKRQKLTIFLSLLEKKVAIFPPQSSMFLVETG
jgi:hypothetical protein